MSQFHRLPIVLVLLTLLAVLVIHQLNKDIVLDQQTLPLQLVQLDEIKSYHVVETPSVNYVVFGSNTPNGESYRSYDYAFNLPLTALAWERIGFRSVVLIIGSRCEWENDPALSTILSHLEGRQTTIIFIASPTDQRSKLSQTARPFAVNLPGFPGRRVWRNVQRSINRRPADVVHGSTGDEHPADRVDGKIRRQVRLSGFRRWV